MNCLLCETNSDQPWARGHMDTIMLTTGTGYSGRDLIGQLDSIRCRV
jgi:hypothetical protein